MDGKHVNVASIKQKITGHKILCLIMAIMLCMLMVPRSLAFAANSKADNAKTEAQKAQSAEKADNPVDPTKEVKPSEENPVIIGGETNFTGVHGTVKPLEPSTKTIDGGYAMGIGVFLSGEDVDFCLDFTEFSGTQYQLAFENKDLVGAWVVAWADGFVMNSGVTSFLDTNPGVIDFELNGNCKTVDFKPATNGHYHISPHTTFKIDESLPEIVLGDIEGLEEGIDLAELGIDEPDFDVPVGSKVGMMDNDHDFFYNTGVEEGFPYVHLEITVDTDLGYKLDGWKHGDTPFEHGETITVNDNVEITPIVIPDAEPVETITLSGNVLDELGGAVPGAYVGYVGYTEEGIDVDYTMTDEVGHYSFDVAPGYYVFAATDLETGGYGITEPAEYTTSQIVEPLVLDTIEIPGALVLFGDKPEDVDHYDFSIYAGEGDDIENMEELPEWAFSDIDIPVWYLFAGSEVYTIGGYALGFRTVLPDFGFGEISLGLVCEPVMKEGVDRLPYCWSVTNEMGETEVVPWINSFVVEDSDDIYYVNLLTAGVGYMCVDGTEGLNHFNLGLNVMGEDIDLEGAEVPGFDNLPAFADEYLGLVHYFEVEEDGTLVSYIEDEDTQLSRTIYLQPEALPGYEFSHWAVDEVGVESYDLEEGEYTWMDEEGEVFNFHAVFVPEGGGADKDQAHGVAQTGDALPFALVGGIALIALASLGVALYSRKRFDA